jgi:hypothetical protein
LPPLLAIRDVHAGFRNGRAIVCAADGISYRCAAVSTGEIAAPWPRSPTTGARPAYRAAVPQEYNLYQARRLTIWLTEKRRRRQYPRHCLLLSRLLRRRLRFNSAISASAVVSGRELTTSDQARPCFVRNTLASSPAAARSCSNGDDSIERI